MDRLSVTAFGRMGDWIRENARPLEVAKWEYVTGTGSPDAVADSMLPYQCGDGGFGHGLEPDLIMPFPTAIGSAEAVFTLMDYGLDGSSAWFQRLLDHFLETRQNTPSFWEPIPRESMDYPRPPWWNYSPDTSFSPNPCAVVAAGMLLHGGDAHRELGFEVAERCISALLDGTVMHDHDIYCMQRLAIALERTDSGLLDDRVRSAMEERVAKAVSTNPKEWGTYVAQPLDLVDSPGSPWYRVCADAIPSNIGYWIDCIGDDGVWALNFSWGTDSPEAIAATRQWKGYMAVKRVGILKAFGAVEGL